MPQLRLHGIELDKALAGSTELVDQLTAEVQCPRDYFTMEVVQGTFIQDGQVSAGYPFVEVLWFDRGQQVQDITAKVLTKWVQGMGYPNVDVFFIALQKSAYYENGEHFG
ncbi:DUF1904 domain-containing protein [Balneatrix alpica]|uniref:DUF1904 domain-containing protein n=1 Tax=Balneatrix alpica TaxID=75684 RepID=UPI002738F436|nr:DUF1904 domain-containing protein [Balneatrix alpica]